MWRLRTHLLVAAGALALGALSALIGTTALTFPVFVVAFSWQSLDTKGVAQRRAILDRVLPLVKGPVVSAISENPRISPGDLGARVLTAVSGLGNVDIVLNRESRRCIGTVLPTFVQSLRASGELAVDWQTMPPTGLGAFPRTAQWMLFGHMIMWGGAAFAGLPLSDEIRQAAHLDPIPMIWIGAGIMLCGAAVVFLSERQARRSRRLGSSGTLAYERMG